MQQGPPAPVVLVGPTGAGKSEAVMRAVEAARAPAEIVAIDAFTVYRGMDIGTAKPGPADRAAVPHHMLDRLEPEEDCSVRWFQHHAREAIAEVQGRGAVPVLVGGSGLYFRTVVDPLAFAPTDPDVRARIEARWSPDPPAAHHHLSTVDPDAAGRIEPHNLRRTVRALEVIELTGRPFSDFHAHWSVHESIYPGLVVTGIDLTRPVLASKLEARTRRMMAAGWLEEVAALQGRTLSDTARQAIGYAELLDHLAGRLSLPEALDRITIRTRRFATRQQRWFARDPRVGWVGPEAVVDVLADKVTRASRAG